MSSAKKQVSVTVSKNGPYIVAGDAPLTKQVIGTNAEGDSLQWQEGKAYDTPAQYALCRRGHSHKAPFCDGTYANIGFDGAKLQIAHPIPRRQRYSTAQALLFWTPEACARTLDFVTRTEKFGIKSPVSTIRIFGRSFCSKSIIVPRAVWSPSTRPPEKRLNRISLSLSA
jgi:CDGSH-type Zn-finger protein